MAVSSQPVQQPGMPPQQPPMTPQAVLAALFPAAQSAAAGQPAAPGTVMPGQAPSQSDLTSMMVQAAQQGLKAYGTESSKAGQLGSQAEQLIQHQGQTQLPPTGPHIQHGGGFLHNLGQALQIASMLTKPGRAIFGPGGPVYGPALRSYEAEHATRAQQIANLTEQEKEHELLAGAGASMVAKPITALGTQERGAGMLASGEAAQTRAAAYAQQVQNNLTVALKGLDLKAIATGSQAALNKAKATLEGVMAQQEPLRTQIEKEGVELGNATRSAVANAMTAAGVQKDYHLTSLIDSIFGTDFTPAAPQTTTGTTGAGATVPPAKSATKPQHKSTSAKPTQYTEGQTATGPNGHKIMFTKGQWVDAATGKPISK